MKQIKQIKQTDEKLILLIRGFFAVTIAAAVLYFLMGSFILPEEKVEEAGLCEEFQADWTWVKADGTRVPIAVPGKCEVEQNEPVTIETILPEGIETNMYLRFWSLRQDMELYIDGVLRQQYSTKATRLFGSTSSAAYVFLRLDTEDAGKTLTVVTQSDSFYSGSLSAVYYGDKMGIWQNTIAEYGMELLVAVLMLALGGTSVVVSMALNHFYRKKVDLEYLGWGIVVAALWILFNSMFRQLIFRSMSVISDLTFLMVMLLALPFLLYMNSVQRKRYQKQYALVGMLVVINSIICIFLQVTNLNDVVNTIKYINTACFIAIGFIGATIVQDIRKGYIREYLLIAIGIMGACVSAIAQIGLYFMKVEFPFSGIMIAVGLIFLLVSAVISTVQDLLQMEREKQEAEAASESKARFLANMSHEIRTPINAVLGMDEMILRESKEKNITEYALDIQSAGRSLLSLINDILDFSKIESGKLEIVPAEYELSSLLNDCYNMIDMRAKEKNLEFRIENNPDLPGRLFGDEIRVRQIMINLLTNAVKYTKEGSITLTVDGIWQQDVLLLKIVVKDTGIGITKEDQIKMFESFQRVDEQKNRNIEGTGLGLTITRQLVELMEGTIAVESEYGKGSEFQVKVPQKIVSHEPVGNFTERYMQQESVPPSQHKSFRAPQASMLVVDDIEMNLKVIKGLLKDTGIQIDTGLSGEQCLEMVAKKPYHIIFLDHMIPNMDGVETLRRMQELPDNQNLSTPVVMLTANALVGAREEYLAHGFNDYLTKPVRVAELEQVVLKYLPQELLLDEEAPEGAMEELPQGLSGKETKSLTERLNFLDAAMGIRYCGNKENLYKEVLKAYVRTDHRETLQSYYEQQDWTNYQIQVHGIKGTSISIGAVHVSELAKSLEMAAKEQNIAYINEHHGEFMSEYERLLSRLADVMSNE